MSSRCGRLTLVNHLLPTVRVALLVLISKRDSSKSTLESEREGLGFFSEVRWRNHFPFVSVHNKESVTQDSWENPHELKSWIPVRSSRERPRKAL